MASIIKVDEIKSQANGSAISIASGGAVTVNNGIADAGTISAGSIGSAVTMSANQACVKTALNASGNPPIYACRAWVNFNGKNTVAIRDSGNVSSITDNGNGDYTVTFTTAMPDANHCAVIGAVNRQDNSSINQTSGFHSSDSSTADNYGAGSIRISTAKPPNSGSTADVDTVNVAIFR